MFHLLKRLNMMSRNAVIFNIFLSSVFSLTLTMSLLYYYKALEPSPQDNHTPRFHLNREMLSRCYTLPCRADASEARSASGKRYLFPMQSHGLGLSGQFESFETAAKFAMFLNRTIVLIPFFDVHAGGVADAIPFNRTYSVESLQDIVPVATVEEFASQCSHEVDVVVGAPHFAQTAINMVNYETTYAKERQNLRDAFSISTPGAEAIPKSQVETIRTILLSQHQKCLGLYQPLDFNNTNFDYGDHLEQVVRSHFVRVPSIRLAAEAIVRSICDGRPFVALHWKNKLGEICTDKSTVVSSSSACQKKEEFILQTARVLPSAMISFLEKYGLKCVYVSQPPGISWGIVKYLAPRIPMVYSSADVIAMTRKLSHDIFAWNDGYILSLLEQEICERAAIFVSGQNSAWSSVVRHNREHASNPRPSLYLSELPGIPKFVNLI